MKYTFVHISDIHIGAIKADDALYQIQKMFLDKIEKIEKVDAIFIAGDLFDTRILVNSRHFKTFVIFFTSLLKIAKEKNVKIRIIKGTESHDYKQLEYIQPLVSKSDVDCKIFNTVAKEQLFDDVKVLYLPEEYMEDKDEFYKDFLDDMYDLIVMHGVVTETCFQAANQESAVTMSKAPVLDTKKLMEICQGPVLAGHIHTKTIIKKFVYYSGSFFRWAFGEEEPKGWNLVEYEDGDYRVTFIENELADKFVTTAISIKDDMNDIPTIIDDLSRQYDRIVGNGVKYRLIFNIPSIFEKPDLLIRTVNEFFSKRDNVKVVIRDNSKVKEKSKTDERLRILYDKYEKVLSKNTSLEEKIHHFVKIKNGKDISVNHIKEYLYKPIDKITFD